MNVKKLHIIGLFIGVFLILGATSGNAATMSFDQGNSGNFEFSNDSVTITVTGNGNVPKYSVMNNGNNDTYSVFFNAIYTANDTNGDGVYNPEDDQRIGGNKGASVALPSSTWDFSEIDNRTDGSVHFDISSSNLGNGFEGVTLELRNHIGADATEIKFDVAISGFDFSTYEDANMLVFVYTLNSTAGGEATQDGNSVSVGDGYFESDPNAQAGGENVDVGLWANTTGSAATIYVAYNQWSGDLVHDPTVGVQASATNPDDNTDDNSGGPALAEASDESIILWDDALSKGDSPLSSFFASFAAVVIPVALYRRK